ncbi:hypothetical protein [Pseudofrankia inefficax]|uniref:hypothetical protein n=1 Tax=Pseudofrankia inefficax (strain DSM 45817 / CECT 9037 / DDB 130130 / EuI1c) TaxID=298654 RepID=UPI0012FD7841|nr:hypothetical protein [Pseudofrankia inefficax]
MDRCSAVPPNIFGPAWEQATSMASGLGSPEAGAYPETAPPFVSEQSSRAAAGIFGGRLGEQGDAVRRDAGRDPVVAGRRSKPSRASEPVPASRVPTAAGQPGRPRLMT